VHSRRADAYGRADAHLAEACATVLAAAVERSNMERRTAAQRAENERVHTAQAENELRRQRAAAAMLRADAEERGRIASELHDDTVQELAAILITLDRVVNAARRGDGDVVMSTAVQARTTLATATERARRLLFQLRPPLLDSGGLPAALRSIAGLTTGGGVDVVIDSQVGRHPQAVEALVYRGMRELIAEARARPGTTRVAVELSQIEGHLVGVVEDDGPHPDAPVVSAARAGLADRITLAGGTLEIRTTAAGGTSARLRVPLS
jgi:signal transduction histidine kinase